MSGALEFLTRGLIPGTGIGGTTRGVLMLGVAPGAGGKIGTSPDPDKASDVELHFKSDAFGADFDVEGGQLVIDQSLLTAVNLSLFSDRLAEADDDLPSGDGDRRGWWGDLELGSRLWLIERLKATPLTETLAREYALEALQWLLEDRVAEAVEVDAEFVAPGVLSLDVLLVRPQAPDARFRYAVVWEVS